MRVWCFHLKDSHKIPIQFPKKGEYSIFRVTLMIPVSETWGYTLTPETRAKRQKGFYDIHSQIKFLNEIFLLLKNADLLS